MTTMIKPVRDTLTLAELKYKVEQISSGIFTRSSGNGILPPTESQIKRLKKHGKLTWAFMSLVPAPLVVTGVLTPFSTYNWYAALVISMIFLLVSMDSISARKRRNKHLVTVGSKSEKWIELDSCLSRYEVLTHYFTMIRKQGRLPYLFEIEAAKSYCHQMRIREGYESFKELDKNLDKNKKTGK